MKMIDRSKLFPRLENDAEGRVRMFALLNLGIIDSLANGTLTPSDATRFFFNAENCRFVKKNLHDKVADEIMGRGVQLQDLFDALPRREAKLEFQHELKAIRSLCLQLLKVTPRHQSKRRAAAAKR